MLRGNLHQVAFGERTIGKHDRSSAFVDLLQMRALRSYWANDKCFHLSVFKLLQQPDFMFRFFATVSNDDAVSLSFCRQSNRLRYRSKERIRQVRHHDAH